MKEITDRLLELSEEQYADFHSSLIPNVDRNTILGIRVPVIRKLAKEIIKSGNMDEFISELPHKYYDENMLHGILLASIKDYKRLIEELDRFLPYVDNWAVCDVISPSIFKKYRIELLEDIKRWIKSDEVYTKRFGIGMLMSHFLDEDFKQEYLELPARIISDEYYVNMMIAWYYATALAKKWSETVPYIEEFRLPRWVHNKTIQKAIDSYRISDENKDYLRGMRIK